MGDFYLGEIRMFSFNYAPQGWALCNGATLQIQQNQALYALLVNHYGSSGQQNFQLPDLCGRAILGLASGVGQGVYAGVETVTLTATQTPQHTHALAASLMEPSSSMSPAGNFFADVAAVEPTYTSVPAAPAPPPALVQLDPSVVESNGGGGPVATMQPFLVMNYCIAMTGYYPPHS